MQPREDRNIAEEDPPWNDQSENYWLKRDI